MKFASVISFFFLFFFCVRVCAARACAMAPVWRSEDSFAGVSSPTFMLAWARAVSAFYSQNHLSGPHLFFVFDSRGAASWIQRAWLHTGDISELWRTFFSPLVMNRGRGPGEHTRPQRAVHFLVSRHRASGQKPEACATGGLQICGCFPLKKVFRTEIESSSF